MGKIWNAAPLQFRGQKRGFAKQFREILLNATDIDTVVDLFGGSGLLSRIAKDCLPNARVIYNDFDHYCDRLANVENTNALLRSISPLLWNIPVGGRVPKYEKGQILKLLADAEKKQTVDYTTLSSSLLFSGNYCTSFNEMSRATMYRNFPLPQKNAFRSYSAEGYLDGLEVVHSDYRELFNHHKTNSKALFIVDPPYLTTECGAYRGGGYWSLSEYLDVLTMLASVKYIYFTSSKSNLIELCDWTNKNMGSKLLQGCETFRRTTRINNVSSYDDFMLAHL